MSLPGSWAGWPRAVPSECSASSSAGTPRSLSRPAGVSQWNGFSELSALTLGRGWIFLGKCLSDGSEELEGAPCIAADLVSEAELAMARDDHLELRYLEKLSSLAETSLEVCGCSISAVNGVYCERGSWAGSPLFFNERGWALFKRHLIEIPELGIDQETCLSSGVLSISGLMERQTQAAVSLLVSRKGGPTRDRSDRSLFAEVVSAGLRQVTAEQTAQRLRNASLLASQRSLATLEAVSALSHSDPKSERPGLRQPTDEEVQIGLRSVFAKDIEYQSASDDLPEKSSARAMLEAELSLDIIRAIERREILLQKTAVESDEVRKAWAK